MRISLPKGLSLTVGLTAALFTLPLAAQTTTPAPGTTPGQLGPQQPASTTSTPATTQVGKSTATGSTTTSTDAQGHQSESSTLSFGKSKPAKDDKVITSKDTRRENKKDAKLSPLVGKDANLPDKALYDKAEDQNNHGHFDVARLDLETLLNTYPDSQYQMRAKLAIADTWYKQGDTASLTQAEQEYNDFITFFPNVPEAAEAQMRVGDIYFKQMDVPDRDYQKAVKAEEAYRLMLKQYPDSSLVTEARQKLREVQEVLGAREAELGAFYADHQNLAAAIARYQTVADTYPQYSHMDDVLIGIGDAYLSQAKYFRTQNILEGPKNQLIQDYEGRAAAEYRMVVLDHAAAPHVEDAKERLADMGLPVPHPTAAQVAASEQLEGSRAQYNLQRRLAVFFLRRPDVVTAARAGDPPLEDPPATVAPAVTTQMVKDYASAFNVALAKPATAPVANPAAAPASPAPAPLPPATSTAPLTLNDVGTSGDSGNTGVSTMTSTTPSGSAGGTSVGIEVITPSAATSATLPAATGAPDPNGGLKTVGPDNTAALPAPEKPAADPDQVNDVAGQAQPPAQTVQPGDKTPKPDFEKNDESSSKHEPKKGVEKLNPF